MKDKKYYLFSLKSIPLNIVSLILFAVAMLILLLLSKYSLITQGDNDLYIVMILYFPYLMIHELFHSLSYVMHGASFKNVTYGLHLEKGVFCCLCKQNVSKKNILISLLYPFIFIGVITLIIGIIINNYILVLLSLLNISGCSGDLVMFFNFLTLKNFEYSEYDDPTSFGLYSDNDLSNKKMFGMEYVGVSEKLEISDLRKIDCSKTSIVVIILTVICSICYLIFS